MVVHIDKLPKTFYYLFAVLSVLAIGLVLPVSQYASGNAHAFPESFAVDNEQRLYLSFGSGGYVVSDGQFERILPSYDQRKTLWISDDNLLSYARNNHITVYDINQSDPEHGDLLKIDDFRADDESFYDSSYGFGMTDEQNGARYTYSRTLFRYTITQEQNGEQSVFFEMPQKDIAWGVVTFLHIVLICALLIGSLLYIYRYAAKHPEIKQRAVYPWQKRKKR